MNPDTPLGQLLAAPVRPGHVTWIGLRPSRHAALHCVLAVSLDPERGLDGDHYRNRSTRSRQVTVIAAEQLAAIASHLGRETVAPELLRRNIVVRGINLLALKGTRFRLGQAVLEATGECHPCSRMETTFGPGGYNAVRGHGGITARILEPGMVQLGDPIERLDRA